MFKIIFLSLLLSICSGCYIFDSKAELGDKFSLEIGEEMEIAGEGIFIKFVSVPDDTRCYRSLYDWYISGKTCSSTGKARIRTLIRTEDRKIPLDFLVFGDSGEIRRADHLYRKKAFPDYRIWLTDLSLDAKNATFLITRSTEPDRSRAERGDGDFSRDFEIKTEVIDCPPGCDKDIFYLTGDGTFLAGNSNGQTSQAEVPPATVEQIMAEVDRERFFELENEYTGEKNCPETVPGQPTVVFSVFRNGREKSVTHYQGCRKDYTVYPPGLFRIEEKMKNIGEKAAGSPADKLSDLESIEFSIKLCSENCPVYRISSSLFGSDSRINLETVKIPGGYQSTGFSLSDEDRAYLITKIEESKFFELDDDLRENCTGSFSPVEISIGYKSEHKTVRHYLNCDKTVGLPEELVELEKKLLEIVRLEGVVFDPEATRTVETRLNQKFKLSVGEEVRIKNRDLRIRFVSVPQDNRCPFHTGAVCDQRGEAVILLAVKKGRNKKTLTLLDKNHLNPDEAHLRFESKDFLNYRIHLKDVPRENHSEISLMVTQK
jgi:hypothetical protein